MKTQIHSQRFTRAALFVFFLMLTPLGAAYAQSPCRVGFLSRSAPTVDGTNAVTVGTAHEWDDASVITSGDPCFGFLIDQNGVTPGSPVSVFTKRYTRTMGGPEFLGFYVEVMDVSDTGVLTTGTVSSGEKFVIQFDPNHSRGAALGGTGAFDFRVIVNHAWLVGGSGIDIQATLSDSSFNTGCGSVQNWTAGNAATGLVVAARRMTGGYKFELEIPTQLVGITGAFPTTDIGVAFAAINDFGGCVAGTTGGGCPNSSYAAFPSDITMTATDNPVTGCHLNWIIPNRWASSSSTAPPAGTVSILRTPDWWKSSSLVAYQCESTSPGYTYYPRHPCRVELKATLENTSGSTQTRNLVFLWAPAGSGDPDTYNFISLVPVEVPNGATQGPFPSGPWGGMPVNESNHPCVRVYILPAVLRTDFDGDDIRAIRTRAQKDDMVSKYGLIDGDWAQKNISRHDTELDCSGGTSCYAARNNGSDLTNIARQEIASLSQQPAPFLVRGGPNAMQAGNNVVEETSVPIVTYPVSSSVQQSDPQNRPPVMSNPGNRISMAANEFEAFHRDNVIVQVRTFETEQPTQSSPSYYRFVQPTGGVIQLFPVKMLEQQLAIPFQFNVTGMAPIPGGGPRILNLAVDLVAPPGIASDVQIAIDTSPQPIRPYELRVIRGVLVLKSQTGGGPFKRWGLSLHGGVSFPHGDLDNSFKPGPNFAVDLEYRFNQKFSAELIYGFHHFRGETFGPFTIDDLNVHQLSVNGKIYGSTSPVRPFFNFGGGAYWFQPGATVRGGLNVGAGVQFDVKPNIAVEGVYNFHNIFFSEGDARFSTVQAGVRFRF